MRLAFVLTSLPDATPAEGHYDVCHVNAFQTQPDEKRGWTKRMRPVLERKGRPVVDSVCNLTPGGIHQWC